MELSKPCFDYGNLKYVFKAGVTANGKPVITLREAEQRALGRLTRIIGCHKMLDDGMFAFMGEPKNSIYDDKPCGVCICLVFPTGSTGLLKGSNYWVNQKWKELGL